MNLSKQYWITEVKFQLEEREQDLSEEKIEQIAENLLDDDYLWGIINERINDAINDIQ